jgi:hypothetical protein
MAREHQPCRMTIEDLRSGEALLSMPINYRPKIDADTVKILTEMVTDIREHRDVYEDPMEDYDGWLGLTHLADALFEILEREKGNRSLPPGMAWLNKSEQDQSQ